MLFLIGTCCTYQAAGVFECVQYQNDNVLYDITFNALNTYLQINCNEMDWRDKRPIRFVIAIRWTVFTTVFMQCSIIKRAVTWTVFLGTIPATFGLHSIPIWLFMRQLNLNYNFQWRLWKCTWHCSNPICHAEETAPIQCRRGQFARAYAPRIRERHHVMVRTNIPISVDVNNCGVFPSWL